MLPSGPAAEPLSPGLEVLRFLRHQVGVEEGGRIGAGRVIVHLVVGRRVEAQPVGGVRGDVRGDLVIEGRLRRRAVELAAGVPQSEEPVVGREGHVVVPQGGEQVEPCRHDGQDVLEEHAVVPDRLVREPLEQVTLGAADVLVLLDRPALVEGVEPRREFVRRPEERHPPGVVRAHPDAVPVEDPERAREPLEVLHRPVPGDFDLVLLLLAEEGVVPDADAPLPGQPAGVARDLPRVRLEGVGVVHFLRERAGQVDGPVDVVQVHAEGRQAAARDDLNSPVQDVPGVGAVGPVPVRAVVVVRREAPVVRAVELRLEAVAREPERAELVEREDRRRPGVQVVDEIDDAAGGVGVRRGDVSADEFDRPERIEIDRLDPGLAVRLRLGDAVEQDPDPPDAGVRPAAEPPHRDADVVVAVPRLEEEARDPLQGVVDGDLPVE